MARPGLLDRGLERFHEVRHRCGPRRFLGEDHLLAFRLLLGQLLDLLSEIVVVLLGLERILQ